MKKFLWKRGVGLLVFATLVAAGACSSDKTSEVKAPEDRQAPAAEVSAGLVTIQGITQALAAATASGDKAKAEELDGQIEPQWEKIEGTIKANDQDAYVTFEDSFALLQGAVKSGNSSQASKGAADVDATVKRYLAKYPG